MKIILRTAFFIFFGTLLIAQSTNLSIDEQIEAIKKAPPKKRVAMMNALKQKLAKMNQEQRIQAIQRMRQKMQSKSQSEIKRHSDSKRHKSSVSGMAEKQQMHTHEQMSQMQNMTQKQAGDQYMHTNKDLTGGSRINENMPHRHNIRR